MFTEEIMMRLAKLSQDYPIKIGVKPKASETKVGDQYTVESYVWEARTGGNVLVLEINPQLEQYNTLLDQWVDYIELFAKTLQSTI